jgi:hypothetical protein
VNRRRLMLDVALGLWLIAGSFIYFRQFVAQGMSFMTKLFGN